jgi:tRNA(Ile)-lysidine synthase
MTSNLLKRFKERIFRQNQGWLEGEKEVGLVVGVSGGSDSVGLARLLLGLGPRYQLNLHLVHINYGTRDKDSDQDEKLVRELAQEFRLPLTVFKFSSDKLVLDQKKSNQEEIFRDFRYQKFEEIRQKEDLNWIAVAHTKDDQAETVLINLLRGTGLRGLGGMKSRTGKVIRPLLDFSKAEIQDFLREKGQEWREDQSNQDFKFLRNRVRGELIPFLEGNYNPKIKDRLNSLAQIVQQAEEYIEEKIQTKYTEQVLEKNDFFELDLKRFREVSQATGRLLLRRLILRLKGDLRGVSDQHLREIEKIVVSEKGRSPRISFSGIVAFKKGSKLIFRRE